MACSAAAQGQTMESLMRSMDAESLAGAVPAGGGCYARLSDDGRQIVQYSYATGKQTGVLFDAGNTVGASIKSAEGFTVSGDGARMLVYANAEPVYRHSFKADYYIYTVRTRKLEPLSDGGKQQIPQFSPDGNQVAFVRDNDIYLVKLLYDNAESRVTKDGKKNETINGAPDWVCEEEFVSLSSFCFNADGTKICWLRYDESAVPTYTLQIYKGAGAERPEYADYPGLYTYKYPKAGQPNSAVTAWSYDIQSHRTQRLQVPESDYMPRILPTDDADRIMVLTLNRRQDELCVHAVNPSSTLSQMVLREKADKYVPGNTVPQIKISSSAILLPSDRGGRTHLYVYNTNGQLLREVGGPGETVTDVYGCDDATGDVYCQIAPTPFDRCVAVSRKNGKTEVLTGTEGWNAAAFSPDFSYFINTWSDMNTPYVVTSRNNKGKTLATIVDNASLKERTGREGRARREMFSFTTSSGTSLNGWILKPDGFSPDGKYPVIMYQYGGPGSQQVVNGWQCASMGQGFDYYLASRGYVVACVDGRGTGGRDADFEKCVYMNLGVMESEDQVAAARWLASQSWADASRIGIWGWSYGGFNALMSMSTGDGVFACGAAVAPVTDWKYYDSVYTERYMRTPQENPDGYADSPVARAGNLSGALLLCFGTMDDNVHPQNALEYTDALVEAGKDFSEVVYTNRNHSIYGGKARGHLLRQIANWFDSHLKQN